MKTKNPSSGGSDWTEFEEVWQYGSDEENDPVWLQDGVAPQRAAAGIPNANLKSQNGKLIPNGRAYIPNDGSVSRGFLDSHWVYNFEWIFTRTQKEKGYVTPR